MSIGCAMIAGAPWASLQWSHESRRIAFRVRLISQMTDRWRVLCVSAVHASWLVFL